MLPGQVILPTTGATTDANSEQGIYIDFISIFEVSKNETDLSCGIPVFVRRDNSTPKKSQSIGAGQAVFPPRYIPV